MGQWTPIYKHKGERMKGHTVESVVMGIGGRHFGHPPVPREHGAWVMFYAPLVVTLLGFDAAFFPATFFILGASGAFFAQNAAGLILRRRSERGTAFWMGVYVVCMVVGTSPLVWMYGFTNLIWIGVLGTGVFFRQATHARAAGKRVDRTVGGELVVVGGLGLTAPGAYVVATGALDWTAVVIWLWVTLYFGSSIFYVKMLIAAAQLREVPDVHVRWQLGRGLGIYHVLLTMPLVVCVWWHWDLWPIPVAFLPILIRAFWGWFRLSNRMPPIRQVGKREILYTLWFAGFSIAALSVLVLQQPYAH